ncbi:MAG: hypothetical protein JNM75_13100 [Rhodospirillales bacterium]|nr:hypothetical protein [Rhodospirillales bacterium]
MRRQVSDRIDEDQSRKRSRFANVIDFPPIDLTRDDEDRIIAKAYLSGYACSRTVRADGCPSIVLLNARREVRGYVTKKHCVYAVLDARETVVARSRSLGEVLTALEK